MVAIFLFGGFRWVSPVGKRGKTPEGYSEWKGIRESLPVPLAEFFHVLRISLKEVAQICWCFVRNPARKAPKGCFWNLVNSGFQLLTSSGYITGFRTNHQRYLWNNGRGFRRWISMVRTRCVSFFLLGRVAFRELMGGKDPYFFGGGKREKCLGKSFCEVQNGSGNLSITAETNPPWMKKERNFIS